MRKRKLSLLFVFFLGGVAGLQAQEKNVVVQSKRNSDKSVELTYEKNDPGHVLLALNFKELSNARTTKQVFALKGYAGAVTTLLPINREQSITYSYNYRYVRGKLNPKIDAEDIYILPYTSGTQVYVAEARFLKATYFGNTAPNDWKSYGMATDEQQAVVASRKGTVVEVTDIYDDEESDGTSFTSKQNGVIIEHKDGTLAHYKGLAKGSVKVKVGDEVNPGTTLALNTKRGDSNRYGITFVVMYLKSDDLYMNAGKTMGTSQSLYGFVTPQFFVDGEPAVLKDRTTYTAESNDDVITREMSKKELKRYQKGK